MQHMFQFLAFLPLLQPVDKPKLELMLSVTWEKQPSSSVAKGERLIIKVCRFRYIKVCRLKYFILFIYFWSYSHVKVSRCRNIYYIFGHVLMLRFVSVNFLVMFTKFGHIHSVILNWSC